MKLNNIEGKERLTRCRALLFNGSRESFATGHKIFKRFISAITFLFIGVALFTNCAGSKKTPFLLRPATPTVAAGVDSSIAAQTDSIAQMLFVDWERHREAQQLSGEGEIQYQQSEDLWKELNARPDSLVPTGDDTVRAIQTFNKGAQQLLAFQKLQQSGQTEQEVMARALNHLDSAKVFFEQALQFNPFDRNTRLWLAKTYQLSAERFLRDNQLSKAALTLKSLIRMDKSRHGIYGRLGQIYMDLLAWQSARNSFVDAEDVLKETAVFLISENQEINDSTEAAVTDSAALFLYVFYQAESGIRLRDSEKALYDLQRAVPLARNETDRAAVKSSIDWINWDDGNIQAAEYRDKLNDMAAEGRHPEAAAGYSALIKQLKTGRAKREIEWRIALLEFSHLDKEDQALNRMAAVTRYYLDDSTGVAYSDTMYHEYFNSYGIMCHNQGLAALKNKKLRRALAYFKQSVNIPWNQQAKSFVEIAKLSINNPRQAVEAAEKALENRTQLNGQELESTFRMMVGGLKRLGRFADAKKYYLEYRKHISRNSNKTKLSSPL